MLDLTRERKKLNRTKNNNKNGGNPTHVNNENAYDTKRNKNKELSGFAIFSICHVFFLVVFLQFVFFLMLSKMHVKSSQPEYPTAVIY